MERITSNITDPNLNDVIEHIQNNAMGNPIIFKSVPASDDMKANTHGFFNNELYVKFANGVCLKFTGTVVS